jgi:hypothetical protein
MTFSTKTFTGLNGHPFHAMTQDTPPNSQALTIAMLNKMAARLAENKEERVLYVGTREQFAAKIKRCQEMGIPQDLLDSFSAAVVWPDEQDATVAIIDRENSDAWRPM